MKGLTRSRAASFHAESQLSIFSIISIADSGSLFSRKAFLVPVDYHHPDFQRELLRLYKVLIIFEISGYLIGNIQVKYL